MSRLLQVVIALIGLALTTVLGMASERSQNMQARHALLTLFSESVSVARSSCDGDMTWVAEDALTRLKDLENSRFIISAEERAERDRNLASIETYGDNLVTIRGTIAGPACGHPAPEPVLQTTPTTTPGGTAMPAPSVERAVLSEAPSANLALRTAEAAAPVASSPADARAGGRAEAARGGYYVVVASYDTSAASTFTERGVSRDYSRIRNAIADSNVTVQVFRTSISNHYAITLSRGALTRENARELASLARSTLGSSDAFIQQERTWILCPAPDAIRSESDCPAAGRR
jgi:hypothetical protein